MTRRQMVLDIQQALLRSGYEVEKTEIDRVFPGKGEFCKSLYGVWCHQNTPTILGALRNRGVQPRELPVAPAIVPVKTKHPRIRRCKCGYADPQWRQTTRCPSCETER